MLYLLHYTLPLFKMPRLFLLLCIACLLTSCSRHGNTIEANNNDTRIQVCFTPGQDCTAMLVDEINAAQKTIEVQAYSFTSYPIAKALVHAQARGVDVEVILDKTQFDGLHFSVAPYLFQHNISLLEDDTVNIAHNKVMIFDNNTVETGSFNFTKAAQMQNAENMLIIHNAEVAQVYLANWQERKRQSQEVTQAKFQN